MGGEPRYASVNVSQPVTVCEDCGAQIIEKESHTRFHSILSGHAWALAVLKISHISPEAHDRYEAYDKISSRQFDSWSADALAEVPADLEA